MSYSRETLRQALLSMDPKEISQAQFGPRVAKKLHGVFLSQPRADAPLNRVYIDNTQIDCYVLIQLSNGKWFKVRPWLTVVSDDCTGMVLGFAISFRAMTVGDILAALRHAILPKAYTEKWVGKSLRLVWEVMGIPDEIVIDNGLDLQAYSFQSGCEALQISVTTTPPMEPTKKARCERIFGTFNTKLFHRLPGTTFGSTENKKKNEYDPKDYACLNLDDLLELMHITFEEMACSYHTGIEDIPIRRWREGVRKFPLRMPLDLQEFAVQMSLRTSRTIGRLGIELYGLYYADDWLISLKARMGGKSTVIVHVRPEDIRQIYVIDPSTQTAFAVSCTTPFDGPMPLYLHQQMRKLQIDGNKHADPDDADASDFRGTTEADSAARATAHAAIVTNARNRREGMLTEKNTTPGVQKAALDARHSMEKPRTAPNSKNASAVLGRSILGMPSDVDKMPTNDDRK
jgi:putative transposase